MHMYINRDNGKDDQITSNQVCIRKTSESKAHGIGNSEKLIATRYHSQTWIQLRH